MHKKNELVYCQRDRKNIFATRMSNQTFTVARHKLSDSDLTVIEDRYGRRYTRNISLETALNSQVYIFEII